MSAGLVALSAAVLLTCGSALGLVVYAVLTTPSMPAERLGLRGLKRMRALNEGGGFAAIEPLMRWLSTRLGGLMSPALRAHLDRQVTLAGDVLGLLPEDVVSLSLLSSATTSGLALAYTHAAGRGPFLVVVAFWVGVFLPYYLLLSAGQARIRSIQRSLPSVVDMMVLGLGAGLDFVAAVRQVIDNASRADEPVIEELWLLLLHVQTLGHTRSAALAQLAERAPCEPVRNLVAMVAQSAEQGAPLANVLADLAETWRLQLSTVVEEIIAKAATKMMAPMFMLFGATLLLLLAPVLLSLSESFL